MSKQKLNVPNPFKLISNLVSSQKEPIYEVEVEKEKKERVKHVKVKKGKFDFEEELTELGFEFIRFKNNYNSYRYIAIPSLILFWNIDTNDVCIYYEKSLISKINFLPNNRLFVEIFVKKTIENLK